MRLLHSQISLAIYELLLEAQLGKNTERFCYFKYDVTIRRHDDNQWKSEPFSPDDFMPLRALEASK
jgi:uncharacterized protein affecting Mg2+/Co2+ transport